MIKYILELTIIHSVLTAFYWLLLRKENQYSFMRKYLLGTMLASLILPFIKISSFSIGRFFRWFFPEQLSEGITTFYLDPIQLQPNDTPDFNWLTVPAYAICLVEAILIIRFILNINKINQLKKRSHISIFNGAYVWLSNEVETSFTFLNRIFMNGKVAENELEREIILTHEMAHIRHKHSLDILFINIYSAIFWWAPGNFYIKKELKKIHEYQADADAIKVHDRKLYSSMLISTLLQTNGLGLASPFHDSFTLKRIKAMKTNTMKIKNWKIWSTGLVIMLVGTIVACNDENEKTEQEPQSQGKTEIIVEDVENSNLQTLENVSDKAIENQVFNIVGQPAEFKEGGIQKFYQYIFENLEYPAQARKLGIEGKVYVQFVVTSTGEITEVRALKGIGAGCDEAAVNIVKNSPAWNPGKQRGQVVNQRMVIPIIFKLTYENSAVSNLL